MTFPLTTYLTDILNRNEQGWCTSLSWKEVIEWFTLDMVQPKQDSKVENLIWPEHFGKQFLCTCTLWSSKKKNAQSQSIAQLSGLDVMLYKFQFSYSQIQMKTFPVKTSNNVTDVTGNFYYFAFSQTNKDKMMICAQ